MLVPIWGVSAQDGSGGTKSIFSLGAGSRAIAMGGAFSAIGNDPAALYYNPAALRLNDFPAVMVNHIQLFSGFSDANYDFAGFSYPTLSAGSLGLGFMTAGTGGIREFDEYSVEGDEMSYRESQAILGYAFGLPWKYLGEFTVGSSVKVLNQRIGDYSDTGTGLDLGILYKHSMLKGLMLGCNMRDIIGAETKLQVTSEKVDRTIMLGAGYIYPFENGSNLSIAVQLDIPERSDNEIRFGAEYSFKNMMSIRVGYDSQQITAGVGFSWYGFGVDYGFFSREEAGSSHPVSLSAKIGQTIEEKLRIREEARLRDEEARIQEIFSSRISSHLEAASEYRESGDLEKALDELKIVLEYDPANAAASETLYVVRDRILQQQKIRVESSEKAILINQHFALGLDYYSRNEYMLARTEWSNVLDLDPENEEAREYLERTEAKLIEQADRHRRRALQMESGGNLAAALGEWNMVAILDPGSSEAASAIERIGNRMRDLDRGYREAAERLRVMELFEDALEAFREGRYAETVELLNDLLELDPQHEEARVLLLRVERRITPLTDEEREEIRRLYIEGMKHFTEKNYESAIAEWNKILEITPDNESIKKNIEEAERRLEKIGSTEED